MAPGRKRGAKKDKDKSGLSLGDLVLAKVKGFPFWPAKISKPEDWQQPPDPKKYFVEFFGTKEIGFVAPVDIQAFTSESKTKLLSRCRRQSKLPKYFKEATEEISEAFEELEQKNSTGLRQDTEGSTIRCSKESNVDGINHDTNKDEISTVGVNGVTESLDSGLGLGSCSNKLGETDCLDIKPSTSGHASDGLTMELTAGENHKVSDGAQAKREASLTSTQDNPSHQKENISSDKDDDDICMNRLKVMTARKGLNSRPKNRISDSEDDSSSDMGDGKKDGSASARVPHRAKKAGGGQNALVNGQKSKKTIIGSKRRREVSNSDVTSLKDGTTDRCDVPESGGHLKDGMKRKIASGDGTKNLSPDASRRVKDQLKNKKRSNTSDDVQNIASSMVQAKGQHSGREKNVQLVKRNVGTNEIAHPAKKLKRVDSGDDATKRLHPESVKTVHPSSNVVEDKSAKHSNIKKSASRVKAENHLASRTQTEMVELKVHDDETVLPLLKRHRREPEAMRDSPIPISDDKTEKNSPVLKTDVPSSNRGLGIQSHKKRRAVRLYDNDEDDEISKTPIHGGSARNVAPSAALDTVKVAESKQEDYHDHPQSIRDDNALEDKLPKELSSGIRKESLPSSQPQAFEKKPKQENYQDHPQSIRDDSALEDKLPKEPSSGIRKQSLPSSQSQALEKKPKQENYQDPPQSIRDDSALEDKLPKEPSSGIRKESLPSSQPLALEKKPKKVTAAHISVSPAKFESNQSKVAKPVITSPPLKPAVEQQKVMKPAAKVYSSSTPKKAQAGSGKGSDTVYENINSSHNQVLLQRNKSASSIERSKTLPKSNSRMNGNTALAEVSVENSSLSGERQEVDREDRTSSLLDSRISDSALSMKDLIAVAQAKRKQTHSQNISLANPNSAFISGTDPHGGSLSPSSALQPFLTGTDSVLQTDMHGSYNNTTLGTPLAHGQQSSSQNQIDYEEVEERRGSSGHRGSLSGGTEAAVARDAFEGMIETLSRTKESIGRATRLAIDCVKYGIANEVVDLLIRKLETEPSSHRKVDLFFLVDSITQCSHNQKGIAGASYIPAVQAALPRLLGAAAPPGAGARENRRQCLKVLRLWLERKILPESLLRRYMDDIGGSNDDTSAGFFLKRPSRAERAVDDPIREMEGMLVDEYGSNATFQLPGFLSCHVFDDEEEDDLPSSSCKETGDATPVESAHALGESETYAVTPNDRRHCILEDVDGELEMEDASGHLKDDRPLSTMGFDINLQQKGSDKILESGSTSSSHLPPFLEGSPPLPLDSPPPPPPLPSSPPPPPPPLSPSPPPPPPPSLPPPAPPSGPPPSLPLPPVLPSGHPPSMVPQPPGATQSLLPPQSAVQSSPQLAYLTPVPQEYCSTPSGNQVVQIVGNTPHGSHLDVSVKGELFQQQSPCFVQPGSHGSRDPSGFSSSRQLEYGNTDMYMTPQVSQPNQQFQSGNAPFGQRPSHPALSQPSSSQFSYSKPTVQQLNQHSYSRPYSLTSHSDGRHRYVTDEQWRMPTSELSADNQRGVWMSGGRTHSSSGPSFVQEGYFRPHPERPPSNNTSFQHSATNNPPAGTPIQGHGVPQILPHRTDMSALNCWRPS